MKKTIVDMPEPLEVPVTPAKKFSLPLAVTKFLVAALMIVSTLHTVSAMFTDKTLEALNRNYTGAVINYRKQVAIAAEALEQKKNLADSACDAYKALKSYKESQKLELSGDGNPCVEFQAPQEVGYEPPVAPGAEGQIAPDPAFQK